MGNASSGMGWKFPVVPDPVTGRLRMSGTEDDIAEAIKVIIRTSPGERVMRESFGCDIGRYVFGTPDLTNLYLIESAIVEALQRWEPRITGITASARPDPRSGERLMITINYSIKMTNQQGQLEFAYHRYPGAT